MGPKRRDRGQGGDKGEIEAPEGIGRPLAPVLERRDLLPTISFHLARSRRESGDRGARGGRGPDARGLARHARRGPVLCARGPRIRAKTSVTGHARPRTRHWPALKRPSGRAPRPAPPAWAGRAGSGIRLSPASGAPHRAAGRTPAGLPAGQPCRRLRGADG